MSDDKNTNLPSCRQCGLPVRWLKKRKKHAKFCSTNCQYKWRGEKFIGNKLRVGLRPANAFGRGHLTWNKGLEGIHLSRSSEFKPGHRGTRRLPVGSTTYRKDKNGIVRAWVKIAEPRKWMLRAIKVWQDANGKVENGCVIHHCDRNALNDDIANLAMLTRAQHIKEHADTVTRWAR